MPTIHLQNIGKVPAVPVSQLKRGDKVMFNFGETQKVKNITKITKASYKIDWVVSGGRTLSTKKRGSTLMARLPFK
jgi:hypothetical protein